MVRVDFFSRHESLSTGPEGVSVYQPGGRRSLPFSLIERDGSVPSFNFHLLL